MNGVGQPCEGEPHARLDGEGLETEQPPPRQPLTRQLRNVTDRLPKALASTVAKRMRRAYHHTDPLVAQAELEALARELDRAHPGGRLAARGAGRDPGHRPAGRVTHAGSNVAVHQLNRVDDRDLP